MGHEIYKGPPQANPKPQKRKKKSRYYSRPGNDKDHKKLITALPCLIPGCGNYPSEPHHLKQDTGERGGQMKSTDRYLVPLCNKHHIHGVELRGSKKEHEWFAEHGIEDPLAIADRLFACKLNFRAMLAIIIQMKSKGGGNANLQISDKQRRDKIGAYGIKIRT